MAQIMFHQLQLSLPLELVLDIVDSLACPTQELAYAYSPETVATLAALSVVSRTISRVAMRHLYNRIFFTSLAQMRCFFKQDHTHRRTLAMGFSAGIPVSAIDTKQIWKSYSASLDRICLEGQIQWFSCQPAETTATVREVALIPGGQRYALELWSGWSNFASLERMAFMHAILHDHNDHSSYYDHLPTLFPKLHSLVISLSSRNKKQLSSFERLLSCLPSLKTVILVEPERKGREYPAVLEAMEEEIGKAFAKDRGGSITEVTAACCSDAKCFKPWFATQVREGTIWTLPGVVWGTRKPEATAKNHEEVLADDGETC